MKKGTRSIAEELLWLREVNAELLKTLRALREERLVPGSPFHKLASKAIEKAEGKKSEGGIAKD